MAHSGLSEWSPHYELSGNTEASLGGQIFNCLIEEMACTLPLGMCSDAMVSQLPFQLACGK